MKSDILFITAIFLIVGFVVVAQPASCHARWEASGHESKWTFLGGCVVKVGDIYMPEKNIRKVDL